MKVTIQDVAKRANTSSATVSRVVSGAANVSKETREAVLRAIKECDYIPRPKKKNGVLAQKDIVLVIVEDLGLIAYLDYIKGITARLNADQKTLLIYSSDYCPEKEVECLLAASHHKYGGVIMLSTIETPSLRAAVEEINIPVVFANRSLRSIEADSVTLDNYKLGYMATNELIQKHHQKIAHLAGKRTSNASLDRLRGYRDAMEAAGLAVPDNAVFFGELTYEGGAAFARTLLEDKLPFTAVFSANETMSVGLMETLQDQNVNLPEELSVICAMHTDPVRVGRIKLSGLGYSSVKMGEKAADLLLERMKEPAGKKMHIAFTPEFIKNNSIKQL